MTCLLPGLVTGIDLSDLGQAELFFKVEHPIYCFEYLPSQNALLIGDKNAHLTALSLKTSKQVVSLAAHNWAIYKIEWINETEFATCSRDKILKIWDSKALKVKQRLCIPEHKGHLNSINNLVSIPSKGLLVSVGDDKQICVWGKSDR